MDWFTFTFATLASAETLRYQRYCRTAASCRSKSAAASS